MKRKLMNILKVMYARLLRFNFIWKRRKAIKQQLKKIRYRKIKRYKNKLMQKYENLSLSDTDYEEVTLEKKERNSVVFGYDAIGKLDHLDDCNYTEYCSGLKGILDNEDIDMIISYVDQPETHREALDYMRNEINLLAVTEGKSYLVTCGEFKAAFIGMAIAREGEVDSELLSETVLKDIVYARQQGVDYIVAYISRETHKSTTATPYEAAHLYRLVNLGCKAVICTNPAGIHVGGDIARMDKTYANAIASIGSIFGTHEEGIHAALAVRHKLIPSQDDSLYIVNKGYIPLYNPSNGNQFEHIMRIDYHNGEHRRDPEMMKALEYIEDETGKLRDIRNILTIGDICNILEVEMPKEYAHLADASVGKVCARSFEVNSGDVLFFREPFEDPNDDEPKPLEIRMRIVEKGLDRGARFIFSYTDLDKSIPHVKLDNAREAHITVCAALRQFFEVRTIGITGSVGKTSTKDMLFNVLEQKYATFRNLRNSNTQVNIGMHIQNFRGEYEFYIQEIGGGRPGGASRHSRMILPEATVITNIGHAHIGNYGSQEKIMESKLGIIDGMDEKGTLFLNADDPLLVDAKVDVETVFYGVNNQNADYYADNIHEENGETHFDIVHGDHRVKAVLHVLGEYNVLNAVCCYAIGIKFGLCDEEIVAGIANFETSGVRQNLISVAGYSLFVDCFNASPKSIDSSLSVLDKIETDQKKIAVIGDVTGMAELSHEIHVEIGNIVKEHQMDILVCYGEESKIVYQMAKEAGINAYHFTQPEALESFLGAESKPGDVLLFKGSSKMLLAEKIDEMFGTMLSDQRYIDGVKFNQTTYNKVRYNLYPDYATVVGSVDYNGKVIVAKSVRGRTVHNLGDGAFSDKENITGVRLHNKIRHIGAGCFHGCGMIKKMNVPVSVKYIGERAFAECNSLEKIKLNEGLLHIADEAFESCNALTELYLPSTIQEMGKDVFANCDYLTVTCEKGSYAAEYCEKNGVQYKLN